MIRFCFNLLFFTTLSAYIAYSQSNFPCDDKMYFFRNSGDTAVTLSYFDGYPTSPNVTDLCFLKHNPGLMSDNVNAIGANPVDGYLYYMVRQGTSNLGDVYRLNNNCDTIFMCTLPWSIVGTFDHLGRYWIATTGSVGNEIWAYDLSTCNAVKGPYPYFFTNVQFNDFVFNPFDCHFYFANHNQVHKIDTNGIGVDTFTSGFGVNDQYGGLAIGQDGILYGVTEEDAFESSRLYGYNLTTQATTGQLITFSDGAKADNFDMASFFCAQVSTEIFSDIDSICTTTNTNINFIDSSEGILLRRQWDFGDGSSDTNSNPSHTYSNAGVYNVKLTVSSNANYCFEIQADTASLTIVISEPFTVNFDSDDTICKGFEQAELEFSATPNLPTNPYIKWIPDDGLSGNIDAPTANPNSNTIYSVIVTDSLGLCKDTAIVSVILKDSVDCDTNQLSIFIPNAFSPYDGVENRFFYPKNVSSSVSNYRMSIFNRWGELVFTSLNPSLQWNGMSNRGKKQNSGVYIYEIVFKNNDKLYSYHGNVNLLE